VDEESKVLKKDWRGVVGGWVVWDEEDEEESSSSMSDKARAAREELALSLVVSVDGGFWVSINLLNWELEVVTSPIIGDKALLFLSMLKCRSEEALVGCNCPNQYRQ